MKRQKSLFPPLGYCGSYTELTDHHYNELTHLYCGINHALAVSIGLIESVPKKLILCLCSTCADNFYGTGAYCVSNKVLGHPLAISDCVSGSGPYSLRRIDPQQIEKDTCTYCNQRKGYDYELISKKR